MIKLSFPTIKLGKYIREVKTKVKNTDLIQENLVVYGVTNKEGITVTNNKASDDLGNYIVLGENQFAYNPYRINVGSIGLTSNGTFGVVSPAYVVFETTTELDSEFLFYYLKSQLGINLIKWYGDRGGVRSALRYNELKEIDIPDLTLEQQLSVLDKVKNTDLLLTELINTNDISLDYISSLRQSILKQAIEGKLCEQNSDDKPASVLVEKIIAEKKIKKQKDLPPITEEEKPYILPKGWEWCRLGDLFESLKYGTSVPCSYEVKNATVLRIPNIDVVNSKIIFSDLKYAQLKDKEISGLRLQKGDILLIRSNGSASLVGRIAVVNKEIDNLCYAGYLMRLRLYDFCIDSLYLKYVFNTTFLRHQIEFPIRTTTGVKNINSTEVSSLFIPLPPLAE
jgi:restriction endonuclease S subunit